MSDAGLSSDVAGGSLAAVDPSGAPSREKSRIEGFDLARSLAFLGMVNYTYQWFSPTGSLSADDVADGFCSYFLRGIETRDPAKVTVLGIASLVLLFVGLALSIVALVLLFRRSQRAPMIAIAAAVLFLPAFLAEQTGHFSSLQAPAAIEGIELVQVVVALLIVVVGFWMLRPGTERRGA